MYDGMDKPTDQAQMIEKMADDRTWIINPAVNDTALFDHDTRSKLLICMCAVVLKNRSLFCNFYALSAAGMVNKSCSL